MNGKNGRRKTEQIENEITNRDRLPPYDEEAEAGLIGSFILDPDKCLSVCIADYGIESESFYVPSHRTIFEAILAVVQDGKVPDLLMVASYLKKNGKLDSIGGTTFVDSMVEACPTSAHAEYYADIVAKKHARRKQIEIGRQLERDAYDEEVDTTEGVSRAQDAIFKLLGTVEDIQSNNDAILDLHDEWREAKEGKFKGLPCFLPTVARKLGMFKRGRLYMLGAAPGSGKTTFMCNQVKYWVMGEGRSERKYPVGVYSAEMYKQDVLGTMICEHADVSKFALDNAMSEEHHSNTGDTRSRIERAIIAAGDFVDAQTGYDKVPLFIEDRHMNSDQFEAWARLLKHRHKIEAIVVDYAQIQTPPPWFRGSATDRITFIADRYRALAKALDIVIILLSQLTGEGGKGKKPTPDELFGGRVLHQMARAVLMLYEEDDQWYVDIQKNGAGVVLPTKVIFNKPRQRWEDLVTEGMFVDNEPNGEM